MFANVRLVTDKDAHSSRIYLNGEDISDNVTSVRVKVACQSFVPEVTVSLLSSPFEYNGDADVKYDFSPDSVNEATRMMRIELAKKGERYENFITGIDEALSKAYVESARAMHYAESLDFAESASESVTYTARYIANALLGLED